jgi:ATP-dependent protease ClpP protease subunit
MAVKSFVFNEALLWYDHGIHTSTRTLYMGNPSDPDGNELEINSDFAANAIKGLHFLDNLAPPGPIRIVLSGLGGDWYYCGAIYDFIATCKPKVNIDVFGPAFSATGVILQGATGERRISAHSRFMMHYGIFEISDYSKIAKNWTKEMDKTDLELEEIYFKRIIEKHPDFDRKELQKMLETDTILNAKETVDIGLADSII